MSLDSKSLYHEAKAAGIIYQATLRHELNAERGVEWQPVDPFTGMADIAGPDPDCVKAWSQRSTRLREWAHSNLVVVDGKLGAAQTAAAQKATRPAKPESLAWEALKEHWHADTRGLVLDRGAHYAARAEPHRAARRAISAPRCAHEREGHEKYTLDVIMAEEARILGLVDEADNRARLDVRSNDRKILIYCRYPGVADVQLRHGDSMPLRPPSTGTITEPVLCDSR